VEVEVTVALVEVEVTAVPVKAVETAALVETLGMVETDRVSIRSLSIRSKLKLKLS
jgi:hypothetical protein